MAKRKVDTPVTVDHKFNVYWVDMTADVLRSSTFDTMEDAAAHISALGDVEELKVCYGTEINFGGIETSRNVKLGGKVFSIS